MTRSLRTLGAALLLAATVSPLQAQAKSPALAVTLSTIGTLAPIAVGIWMVDRNSQQDGQGNSRFDSGDEIGAALIVTGAIMGPALGHFYAHEKGLFWYRLGIGAAAGTIALTAKDDPAVIALVAGGAAVGIMGVMDIIRTPEAVRRFNAAHAVQARVAPAIMNGKVGLAVGVRAGF
jgi:hypothetical protein